MGTRPLSDDDRAFSETFAVGVLVAITLTMVLSVGVYVLAVGAEEETTQTEFSYDYDGSSDALVVRYAAGEEYQATEILLESDATQATWAELAGTRTNATIAPGDAIQLSRSGRWGRPVTDATELRILHTGGENSTQLSNWSS